MRIARAIARSIREQSGGLKHVRALGFSIEGGRRAQVSMNLLNTEATPIHRVLALIRDEAARHGAAISGCEVVGLIPESCLLDAAEHALQLEAFRRDQVLERRLRRPPLGGATTIASLFEQLAAPTPTPGGGTAAAFAGALASCLATMVANLSIGKKKYLAHEPTLRDLRREAEAVRTELLDLARRDGDAFEAVLRAARLPHGTTAETVARDEALVRAGLEACRVPLCTAAASLRVIEIATEVAKLGNPNAITDAGVAGLLAHAGATGALCNVEINLKSLPESADKQGVEMDLRRLRSALDPALGACRQAVQSILGVS